MEPAATYKDHILPKNLTAIWTELISEIQDFDFSSDPSNLSDRIDQWVLACLKTTQDTDFPLQELFDRISQLNSAVTTRIIQNKMTWLETHERLVPPLPFCWISMGSDARDEQVIRTDQDNALIYADPAVGQDHTAAVYFKALATQVTKALDRFGFTYCPGDVMATNPDWCRPLNKWLTALDSWVGSTEPDAVRKLTILLDFKAVFGDQRLAATLQTRVFKNFEKHEFASHLLVRDDQLFAPPKTRFNRIRTRRENGCRRCFNIKTQAIAHIVNGARLFAVNHGIRIPATLKRLSRLEEDGILTQTEHQDFSAAFAFLTRLKLTTHLDGKSVHLPGNCIDVSAMDHKEKKEFDRSLDAVTRFQKKMAETYNQAWMNFFN